MSLLKVCIRRQEFALLVILYLLVCTLKIRFISSNPSSIYLFNCIILTHERVKFICQSYLHYIWAIYPSINWKIENEMLSCPINGEFRIEIFDRVHVKNFMVTVAKDLLFTKKFFCVSSNLLFLKVTYVKNLISSIKRT